MTIKVSQMNINKRRKAAGTGALSNYFPEPNEPWHRVLQPDQQLLIKFFIHSHTISPMFAKKRRLMILAVHCQTENWTSKPKTNNHSHFCIDQLPLALKSLSVIGFSFVFYDKAIRREQGNLLVEPWHWQQEIPPFSKSRISSVGKSQQCWAVLWADKIKTIDFHCTLYIHCRTQDGCLSWRKITGQTFMIEIRWTFSCTAEPLTRTGFCQLSSSSSLFGSYVRCYRPEY